jgi:hypothetical protein
LIWRRNARAHSQAGAKPRKPENQKLAAIRRWLSCFPSTTVRKGTKHTNVTKKTR